MYIHSTGYHGVLSLNNGNDTFAKQHVEIPDNNLR